MLEDIFSFFAPNLTRMSHSFNQNELTSFIHNKKNIIWDYNGTMLDDVHICINSINQMLVERNINPIDELNYKSFFDFPVKDYYQKIGFDFSVESFETVGKLFVDIYDTQSKSCQLHKDVLSLLQTFHQDGKRQFVLSARQKVSLADELKFHKIEHFFEKIYGLNDLYAYGKTQLGIDMMKELNLIPSETILIGDTCHDAEVGSEMGIDVLLLSHGHHHKDRLLRCGSLVIDELELLMKNK